MNGRARRLVCRTEGGTILRSREGLPEESSQLPIFFSWEAGR